MTKGRMYELYKAKRQKLATKIRELIKTKDSKEKFQKLIKLTKEYEKITADMNLDGIPAKVYPLTLSSKKWIDAYDLFMKEYVENCRKSYRSVKQMTSQNKYNIMLCWTIKSDCYICTDVITTIKKYFETIGLKLVDTTKIDFPDRIETCETYKIACSKDVYETILASAKFVLAFTTAASSAYETCNIGIFGKEL